MPSLEVDCTFFCLLGFLHQTFTLSQHWSLETLKSKPSHFFGFFDFTNVENLRPYKQNNEGNATKYFE